MTTYTVTTEFSPGCFRVVKEVVETDGENVNVYYDFRGSISAPGVVAGASSGDYMDLFSPVGMVRV